MGLHLMLKLLLLVLAAAASMATRKFVVSSSNFGNFGYISACWLFFGFVFATLDCTYTYTRAVALCDLISNGFGILC